MNRHSMMDLTSKWRTGKINRRDRLLDGHCPFSCSNFPVIFQTGHYFVVAYLHQLASCLAMDSAAGMCAGGRLGRRGLREGASRWSRRAQPRTVSSRVNSFCLAQSGSATDCTFAVNGSACISWTALTFGLEDANNGFGGRACLWSRQCHRSSSGTGCPLGTPGRRKNCNWRRDLFDGFVPGPEVHRARGQRRTNSLVRILFRVVWTRGDIKPGIEAGKGLRRGRVPRDCS